MSLPATTVSVALELAEKLVAESGGDVTSLKVMLRSIGLTVDGLDAALEENPVIALTALVAGLVVGAAVGAITAEAIADLLVARGLTAGVVAVSAAVAEVLSSTFAATGEGMLFSAFLENMQAQLNNIANHGGGNGSGNGDGGDGGGAGNGGGGNGSGNGGATPPGGGPLGQGGPQGANNGMNKGNHATSPLVLDMAGTGLDLSELSNVSPYFDLDGSGFAHKTGWIGPNAGLLAIDINGDGKINSGTELFGTADGASDGFAQLRQLDSNGDGVINGSDTEFGSLRVWIDADGDGVTDSGELFTLSDLHIASISLGAASTDQTIAGNEVKLVSHYTMSDGTQKDIADVWFTNSPTYTEADTLPVLSQDVASLPQLSGYGALRDLRSSAMTDTALKSDLSGFVTNVTLSSANILGDVRELLLEWSGSSAVVSNSRGEFFDAQELDFLEKYTGIPFVNEGYAVDGGPDNPPENPRWLAAVSMRQAWNSAYDSALARLLLQTDYDLPEFVHNETADAILPADNIGASFSALFARLGDVSAQNETQWEIALRVADAFRLDVHLLNTAYLSMIADNSSNSVAALASALISGEEFSVGSDNSIVLTGVTSDSILYSGANVRSIELDGVASAAPPALNDTIRYDMGDGALDIKIAEYGSIPNNILEFGQGVIPSNLFLHSPNGYDVIIEDGVNGDQITLKNELLNTDYGVQSIVFSDGTVWTRAQILTLITQGTTGNNTLYGTSADDAFDGKGGSDYEVGNGGNDTFVFNAGYGALEIYQYNGSPGAHSVLQLGTGINPSDVTVTSSNGYNLTLTDSVTGEHILLDNELSSSGYGLQDVVFANGTVWSRQDLIAKELVGTTGDNSLYGTSGSDVFDGKGGSDHEAGAGGNDTFVFNAGYGTIAISQYNSSPTAHSVLQLGVGINASEISVTSSDGYNLTLTDSATGDHIVLDNELFTEYGVQDVVFADGTVWSQQDLITKELLGTTGNNSLYGTSGSDVFDGKGGSDHEAGAGGDDTFIFNAGYGTLAISQYNSSPTAHSVLQLGVGINASEISVTSSDGYNLTLTDSATGDHIVLDNELYSSGYGTQEIVFSDGTTWSRQDLITKELVGTTGNNSLYGTSGSDVFDGKGGSDHETGAGGNDTFIFNAGYGALVISQYNSSPIAHSVLQLGAGIDPSEITVAVSSTYSLTLTNTVTGDHIVLDNELYSSAYGVQDVVFADGTIWSRQDLIQFSASHTSNIVLGGIGNDALYGSVGVVDFFDGKGGSDYEQGDGGGDTFVFNAGYGSLEINEHDTASMPNNVLLFGSGINASDITVQDDGQGNFILSDILTGDGLQLDDEYSSDAWGVQKIKFSDGTIWTRQDLLTKNGQTGAGDNNTTGTTGDDSLYGSASTADTFDGRGGSDYEQGDGGGDTFIFNAGYGNLEINNYESSGNDQNKLVFGAGVEPDDVLVTADTYGDFILSNIVTGDVLQLDNEFLYAEWGVQTINFANGASWDRADLLEKAGIEAQIGTSGDDALYGSAGSDLFDGKGGSDYEQGGGGNDRFIANAGYGNLEVDESDAAPDAFNLLRFGPDIDPDDFSVLTNSTGDFLLLNNATGEVIQLDGELRSLSRGVQIITFFDGTEWTRQDLIDKAGLIGTSGDDSLIGSGGVDVFDCKGGTDYARGNGGNDVFVFNGGYGALEIDEYDADEARLNVLQFGVGIHPSDISVTVGDHGSILLADSTSGDSVRIDSAAYDSRWGIQRIEFSDGTIWSQQDVLGKVEISGTSGDDSITGTNGADLINAKGGNDFVAGDGGNDVILFGAGDGTLEISEYDESPSADNVLVMGVGINAGDLSVRDDGYGDAVIYNNATGDTVLLDSEIYSAQAGVQEIRFSDGTEWTRDDLIHSGIVGTAGDDTLDGTSGNDIFDGLGGTDAVGGWLGGNDTYLFNQGYGVLEIEQWSDDPARGSTLVLGPGMDPGDFEAWADGYGDLVFYDDTTGDQVLLDAEISSSHAGVQKVVFSDSGTVWTRQDLLNLGISGTSGNNTLNGTADAEFFQGKGGVDTINGGGGNDFYIFKPGDGQVTINNIGGSGAHGSLEFSEEFDDEDLWFKHTGNDLVIQRIGSTDKVTVAGWFGSNSSAKLAEITLDGNIEVDSQLNSLISAMATYSTAHGSFNPATATTMPADTTLQNTIAASWHG